MRKNLSGKTCIALLMSILIMLSLFSEFTDAYALTDDKTYEIAVVFDNSGSMYEGKAWCRAKFAMEIFASMLNYDNGDILKIFPMWAVTTDGTMPKSGGSYDVIEICNRADIDKISNLYTIDAGGTPFAPVREAYSELKNSAANEKWMIILTDGDFNADKRNVNKSIKLRSELLKMASEDIKIQYLGMGSAESVKEDASKFLYSENLSENQLQNSLVQVCNNIFQRDELPRKYLSSSSLTLDMSMKNIIVFVQGDNASIGNLIAEDGTVIKKTLDSGQRKFSQISSGNYKKEALVDNTLYGQVVTFDSCAKGKYALEYSNAGTIQVFYEPDVDIRLHLIDKDGEKIGFGEKSDIIAGDYMLVSTLTDGVTGEDVTSSELLGGDVVMSEVLKTSDGTEKQIREGELISLSPDENTQINVTAHYLDDYSISGATTFSVKYPELGLLSVDVDTKQKSSWFQLGKEESWQPVEVSLLLNGQPLSDEELDRTELKLDFSGKIDYKLEKVYGKSQYNLLLGYNESNMFIPPESEHYELGVTAVMTDEFGQSVYDDDETEFDISGMGAYWKWMKYVLPVLFVLIVVLWILTRKAWPKAMYFVITEGVGAGSRQKISIKNNNITISGLGLVDIPCKVEKATRLYRRWGKKAEVKVVQISLPANVKRLTIGVRGYVTGPDGKVMIDGNGVGNREFVEDVLYDNLKIEIERINNNPRIVGKIAVNKSRR